MILPARNQRRIQRRRRFQFRFQWCRIRIRLQWLQEKGEQKDESIIVPVHFPESPRSPTPPTKESYSADNAFKFARSAPQLSAQLQVATTNFVTPPQDSPKDKGEWRTWEAVDPLSHFCRELLSGTPTSGQQQCHKNQELIDQIDNFVFSLCSYRPLVPAPRGQPVCPCALPQTLQQAKDETIWPRKHAKLLLQLWSQIWWVTFL